MRYKNRDIQSDIQSVEEFQRLRDALSNATNPQHDMDQTVYDKYSDRFNFDALPDDHNLDITSSVFMHAGMGVSQVGVRLGLEAPHSLQEVHRRGELFMFVTLGAAAIYEATKTVTDLL